MSFLSFCLYRIFFYSDDVDISVQRDGEISFETIRIKSYKIVSDLLERGRWILNFEKHDQLSAHKIPNGERINDFVRIRDIASLGTVVIKCAGTGANHEDVATHENHGLGLIPEKQDGSSDEIRHRGDLSESGTARRGTTITAYKDEIKFLNLKLEIESALKVEGFVYEIVPEDYTHRYKEKEKILTFFSEKEHKEKRSKIRVVPYWSDWQPQEALPCLGVRINNNVGKDDLSKQSYRIKNQKTGEMPVAIVTKTSFHQVRQFGVNVTINEKAVKEAKKILKAKSEQETRTTIKKFNDKYCSFVYSGKFSAGAWLKTVATARRLKRLKEQESTNLEKCATQETDHYWSCKIQSKRSSSYRSSSYRPLNKDPSVKVSVFDVNDPPNIRQMYELEEKIGIVENCTIFPANWDEKSHFIPVYDIMKSQAVSKKDKDLRKVADIFKECMKGKTAFLLINEYLLR